MGAAVFAVNGPVHAQTSGATAPSREAATTTYDIPAGPLAPALNRAADIAGLTLVYATSLSEGLRTNGLSGRHTANDALAILLAGTGLTFRVERANTVVIERARSGDTRVLGPVRVEGEAPARSRRSAGVVRRSGSRDSQDENDGRPQAFSDANLDIPRTIDDVQPYYIFDSRTLDQSGATNIEDFLKQRLTMNTVAQTNAQITGEGGIAGNTSTINLRGLGSDKTLILINGRRMAGISTAGASVSGVSTELQPDLNGFPLSAIERIEVLPSSASGIYGGSAIGGVVNVVLKRDYSGGELRATYDNTWDTDSPRRSVSSAYGLALEGGKTHVSASAFWSDAKPLLVRDRRALLERNMDIVQRNDSDHFFSGMAPWLGSLPNIASAAGPTQIIDGTPAGVNLTLKDGTPLGSPFTHIDAGTSGSVPGADLNASLLANAGEWNLDLPLTTQSPTGLLQPIGASPEIRSLRMSARRQMVPRLEVFADLSYQENRSDSIYNPFSFSSNLFSTVPASAPTNPFRTSVRVRFPYAAEVPMTTEAASRSATLGAIVELPRGWKSAWDYTWSESRFRYRYFMTDVAAGNADLASGALNPFVDTTRYPLDLEKYLAPRSYRGSNRLHDLTARASGPLPALPWGTAQLTAGLEHRIGLTPERTYEEVYPITVTNNALVKHYERESTTDSGYAEAAIPLIRRDWLPGIRELELQLSGRMERFEVDTGTSTERTYYSRSPVAVEYGGPTLDGKPYYSKASYASTNYTVGFRYQPIERVTFRASRATAFLPPTPSQLIRNPEAANATVSNDPVTGARSIPVQRLVGGNPDLRPQNSKSLNAGIILEPEWAPLRGLRVNAEYYRIEQFDYIGALSVQQIVDQESSFPGRVVRDGGGTITQVDSSSLNLYRRETEGWDLSADYSVETAAGWFDLRVAESIITALKTQYSQTQPEYEAAGYWPGEGGAAKYKTNATLTWESQRWTAGWTARYFSSYKASGAAGGPLSMQFASGGVSGSIIQAQGSDTIPSQTYHDVFAGYTFGSQGLERHSGLNIQVSVRNVFNKVPPLDVAYGVSNFYVSPYGDTRLRSYAISLAQSF